MGITLIKPASSQFSTFLLVQLHPALCGAAARRKVSPAVWGSQPCQEEGWEIPAAVPGSRPKSC